MMGLIAGIIIILGFAVLIVAIVLLRSFTKRQDNGPVADETRLVQDMYRTLDRLEKRVDVLETLLADQSGNRDHHTHSDPLPPHQGDRHGPY